MTTETLRVRALDLGCVRSNRQSYRSIGFDLTQITGRVTGCWIRFGSPVATAGVRLGEAGRRRSYLAHEPAAFPSAHVGRRRMTAIGVSLVNEAVGGYLSLETWGDCVAQACRSDIYLELQTAVSMPERQAA